MTSESKSTFGHVHVPQLDCVVHGAGEQKVSRVVIGYLPNGLAMLSERLSAAGSHEVPNLDGAIARRGSKQIALGVELDTTDPVKVTFSTHDQVTIGHRPQLPGCVVRACGNDVFFRVVAERCHTHQMTLESLGELHM